jgi:hypothetical protein
LRSGLFDDAASDDKFAESKEQDAQDGDRDSDIRVFIALYVKILCHEDTHCIWQEQMRVLFKLDLIHPLR